MRNFAVGKSCIGLITEWNMGKVTLVGERRCKGGRVRLVGSDGRLYLKVGDVITLYGRCFKAVAEQGWGCEGCGLNGRCHHWRELFGSCRASERPDGVGIVFVDLCGDDKRTRSRVREG